MKKRARMSRIKKDIMKCNFPTKIKFMGLPEKKTMFISQTITIDGTSKTIQLNPFDCDNMISLFHKISYKQGTVDVSNGVPNFDKMCILAVYIKMTPNKNMWTGVETNVMAPINCYYSINNVETTMLSTYEENMKNLKQNFAFNCNENFTIYIHKPHTIQDVSGVIYKPGTWWSLGEYYEHQWGTNTQRYVNDEEDDVEFESSSVLGTKGRMNAGRLYFYSKQAISYTATISYKIALKG